MLQKSQFWVFRAIFRSLVRESDKIVQKSEKRVRGHSFTITKKLTRPNPKQTCDWLIWRPLIIHHCGKSSHKTKNRGTKFSRRTPLLYRITAWHIRQPPIYLVSSRMKEKIITQKSMELIPFLNHFSIIN